MLDVDIVSNIDEVDAYLRLAKRSWSDVHPATAREMGEFLVERMSRSTGTKKKAYTGALSSSFSLGIEGADADGSVRGEVVSSADYARYVDGGRRPGSAVPPVDVIEKWAERKLGRPGLGFVIARAIARKGIKKRRYRRSALSGLRRRREAIANKALERFLGVVR